MKKKRLLFATLLTVLCVCIGVFGAACSQKPGGDPGTDPGKDPEEKPKTYSVLFDVQGHGTAPETLRNVVSGSTIEKPADPVEDEWTFGGWYKEKECENEWNFASDKVTSTRTLYAQWTQVTYTVTYDVQGHGTAPAGLSGLVKGAKLKAPQEPEAQGYIFDGWYKEKECKNVWNFQTDIITQNVTLYADWIEIHEVNTKDPAVFEVSEIGYFTVPATGKYTIAVAYKESGVLVSDRYTISTGNAIYYLDVDTETQTVSYISRAFSEESGWVEVSLAKDAAYTATENENEYSFSYQKEVTAEGQTETVTVTVTFTVQQDGNLKVTDGDTTYDAKFAKQYMFDEQAQSIGSANFYLEAGSRHTVCGKSNRAIEVSVTFVAYDLPFTEKAEYVGEKNKVLTVKSLGGGVVGGIKNDVCSATFGGTAITVIAIDGNIYTVSDGTATYGLEFVFNGEAIASIKVYEAEGEGWKTELYDTLTKIKTPKEVAVKLQANEEGVGNTVALPVGYSYAVIDVSEWIGQKMIFSDFAEGTTFHWINPNYGGAQGSKDSLVGVTSGTEFLLKNDYNFVYIAVTPANAEEKSVTFTAQKVVPPKGSSEDNPLTIEGNTITLNSDVSTTYYLEFTGTGAYEVTVCRGGMYNLYYTINGVGYGFYNWKWVNITNDDPVARVTLDGTTKITVLVDRQNVDYVLTIEKAAEVEPKELEAGNYRFVDETVNPVAVYKLTIAGDKSSGYTVNYSYTGEFPGTYENLAITDNVTSFTFTCPDDGFSDPVVTITIKADGSLHLANYDGVGNEADFAKATGDEVDPPSFALGRYKWQSEDGTQIVFITVNVDNTVDYMSQSGGLASGAALVKNDDGTYSFTRDGGVKVTFTPKTEGMTCSIDVVDGSLTYTAINMSK